MLKRTVALSPSWSRSSSDAAESNAPRRAGKPQPVAAQSGGTALTGAGATFPAPLYTKWFDVYAREAGVKINYQSIGSGGGIRQFVRAPSISAPPMGR